MILMLEQGPVHARFRIGLGNRPISEQRSDLINDLIRRLDTNKDKELTREEANQSCLLRRKARAGTAQFLKKRNLNRKQTVSLDEVKMIFKQIAGQPVVFRQNDAASESDEFIFGLIDEDGSGVIDTNEMSTAAKRLITRDSDRDECIGFDEVQPPEPEPDPMLVGLVDPTVEVSEFSHSVFSEILRRADDPKLAQRLLMKYDRNGNGRLSPKELRWDAGRISSIDKNKDGELSRSDLANIHKTPLDIDLTVDVSPSDPQKPELRITHCSGKRLDRVARPGISNMTLQNATVTISYRHVDPIAAAIDNARRKFNLLDADVNGYLDEAEIEGETLLERGLFKQIDADDDKKMFSHELEAFVRERAEVKAMSCRVNVYDTGSGFFQSMDHNNDGRISIREMRGMKKSLLELRSDDKPGVAREEPARRFHIEFSRGEFQLFGPGEQVAKETISFNTRIAAGPKWFVGSDRNNDGDLTWNEFLGHREDFHFLDKDRDGLIDPAEAEQAVKLKTR
jgi:Ca2+-binding EF-hand superfamily protein